MDFKLARHNMVESQIRPNEVTDPLLIDAMATLPREAFVPEALAGVAYVDEAVPIGNGRYLMEPMILARLIQIAEVQDSDAVLNVGCNTGYAAAVLSKLASAVVAVEETAELAATATEKLEELGIDNVAVMEAELKSGYPKQSPYDVILFGGAVAEIPETISRQLADGGRLVAIVQRGDAIGHGVIMTRFGDTWSTRDVFDAGTPFLPGFEPVAEFQF